MEPRPLCNEAAGIGASMTQPPRFEEYAILVADMVGYSGWLAEQPAATHTAFTHHLRGVFEPSVRDHGGRIVKTTGDGFLAIFRRSIPAELCARQIQNTLHHEKMGSVELDSLIEYRLAIDFGLIVVESHDVFGLPVNTAIHMQSLAPPGGICVSEPIFGALPDDAKRQYQYIGRKHLKNLPNPVAIYYNIEHGKTSQVPSPSDPLCAPRRSFLRPPPRLGVAEFDLYFADQSQEIVSRIVRDTILRSFSRFRDLFFTVPVGYLVAQRGREDRGTRDLLLKERCLDYVIYGSFLAHMNDFIFTAYLEDTKQGGLLWTGTLQLTNLDAEAIDRVLADEFIAPVAFHVQRNEMDSQIRSRSSMDEDRFRTAQRLLSRGTLESTEHARLLLHQILNRCGDIGDVHVALARAEHLHGRLLAGQPFVDALERARKHAVLALEINDLSTQAHSELALQEMFLKRQQAAAEIYQRALRLNPYDLMLQADWADCLTFLGRAQEALPILEKVSSGWPRDRNWVEWNLCDAYWALDRPDRIVELLDRHPDQPHVHRYLAASHAKLGNRAKAEQHAQKVREHQPGFSTKAWSDVVPYTSANASEEYAESLERAGL
jgi:adenylate cyclase